MLEQALKTQIMNQVDRQFDDQTKVLADLVQDPVDAVPRGAGAGHDGPPVQGR